MLNTIKKLVTGMPREPVAYYGLVRDIWPGVRPGYVDAFCWYCATCGENHGEYSSDAGAERAACRHADTHEGVRVEREVPRHARLG